MQITILDITKKKQHIWQKMWHFFMRFSSKKPRVFLQNCMRLLSKNILRQKSRAKQKAKISYQFREKGLS